MNLEPLANATEEEKEPRCREGDEDYVWVQSILQGLLAVGTIIHFQSQLLQLREIF